MLTMTKRILPVLLLSLSALTAQAADPYPARPVKLIVGFPP
ncbi:MAG: tripartite tricarboxylate transporter substrate binding protein, partial [Betaproteobacteria bacterium]|nr:tripartite tricarboxylate transporter substrate binding protein [Betaproteobacteria bacterium]